MNIDKRLDCYERYFMRGEEEGLLSEVQEMEDNSVWIADIRSAGMELEANCRRRGMWVKECTYHEHQTFNRVEY